MRKLVLVVLVAVLAVLVTACASPTAPKECGVPTQGSTVIAVQNMLVRMADSTCRVR